MITLRKPLTPHSVGMVTLRKAWTPRSVWNGYSVETVDTPFHLEWLLRGKRGHTIPLNGYSAEPADTRFHLE